MNANEALLSKNAINCPTLKEAIEINRIVGGHYSAEEIKKHFEKLDHELCYANHSSMYGVKETIGFSDIDFYVKKGFTLCYAKDFLPKEFYN
jgi:hypothetical protein